MTSGAATTIAPFERTVRAGSRWGVVPLMVALALVAAVWLRYADPWADVDTAVLAHAARAVLNEGTVTPSQAAYDHGFAYPTLLASLAAVTGLPIRELQTTVLPWLTVATALMAFAAFRAISGSARAGAVAASLLFVQPDFLFVNQRGSHEKMTWTLVLALIFALMASLRGRRLQEVAPYVIVFYLCGFAFLCTNAFFGSSFTTIILLSLLGGILVARRFFRVHASRRLLPRLAYVFIALTMLTYLIVFYLYAPATNNLASLGRLVDRLAALYLNVETQVESRVSSAAAVRSNAAIARTDTTTSPYAPVSLAWANTRTFFMLTTFTWVMILSALLAWLALGTSFLRRGVAQREVPLFLVWAFTAAAAVQIAASVATDFAGALGSNLQLRLFPVFAIFAVPLVVATILHYPMPRRSKSLRWTVIATGVTLPTAIAAAYPPAMAVAFPGALVLMYVVLNWRQSLMARRLATVIGVGAFLYFAGAATLKATNDPLVSNKWTFYSDAEAYGLRWGNEHLARMLVWAEFDERLREANELLLPDRGGATEALWTRSQTSSVRYVFMSDIIAARSARIGGILPDTRDDDRIYDNGRVSITHRVPQTPYQP